MPRSSVEGALRTRAAILDRAVDVASLDGLDGMSIGRLATDLGLSKAGVLGQFGSKEALQLAAVEAANERFTREVWDPAADAEPGLPRLLALCDSWISYLEREVFPGGCFFSAVSFEVDDKDGPVRDALLDGLRRWHAVLRREIVTAQKTGELDAELDPDQVSFELRGVVHQTNQALRLDRDPRAGERGRRAMRRILSAA
jgi:AcrR family transcriptional regulator